MSATAAIILGYIFGALVTAIGLEKYRTDKSLPWKKTPWGWLIWGAALAGVVYAFGDNARDMVYAVAGLCCATGFFFVPGTTSNRLEYLVGWAGRVLAVGLFAALCLTGCSPGSADSSEWRRWSGLSDPAYEVPVHLVADDAWDSAVLEAVERWESDFGGPIFRLHLDSYPPEDFSGKVVIMVEAGQDRPEEFTDADPSDPKTIRSSTILLPPLWSDKAWAAAHELGHALGIPHLEGCRSCLMAPVPPPFPGWEISAQSLGHVAASRATIQADGR